MNLVSKREVMERLDVSVPLLHYRVKIGRYKDHNGLIDIDEVIQDLKNTNLKDNEKRCPRCEEVKKLYDFTKDKLKSKGVSVYCKLCQSDYRKTVQKRTDKR